MAVQINVAANQAALISSIQAGVQAYNQRFANNNQINLNINARAFSQPLGRITGDVKDFEAALAASNARVIAFGASTAVLGGVIRSFKELATVTIDVEKNLADINRVFGLSTSQLQKFSTELFNVSKQTASTFDNASKAALEFSRQGLKAEETLQRTKDALTLTRLAGIGTANAVDALTSTVNGFAATGVTTSQILNKLIAVEQDFAVGAGDLAEALSRTGQAAQEAGVSLDQLNALVTSAQQSTARGGAVIGNALKTIFTRLQRTETLDQLEAFNIAVRDVQGNILPAVTILQNFAGVYKNLADAQRAQLSEQVAGVYQVNILKAIVNDLNKSQGVYAGALQRGAMATNEAEVATAKLNKTLDALLSQTATSAQQLANNIGKVTFEPLARYGTEQLKSLVESMNEILEGEGIGSTFANGLLKGIRNILAGPGAIAAFFTLFKLIQNSFSFLTQALPQIAGITTETQNRKNIEQSILQIMQQQGPISQALAGTMGNQAAQAQLLLQLARQQTAEYQQQSALAKQLAAQLAGQGVKVAGARGLQVTRAGGYVPTATKLAEVVGAKAGGYNPGRVVPSPVGGVMNTAEDVKYIPGFAQPFINPPANSKAGRTHRQNAINRTGIDPYMAGGFIPNFSDKALQATSTDKIKRNVFKKGLDFESDLYTKLDIEEKPGKGATLDFPRGLLDASRSKNKESLDKVRKSGVSDQTSYGDAKLSLNYGNITSMISKYLRENDLDIFRDLSFSDANYAILYKNGPPDKEILNQKRLLPSLIKKNPSLFEQVGNNLLDNRSNYYKLNKKGENTKIELSFFGDRVLDQAMSKGFIPNFAPPTSAIRVPWFRKFGNPAFDAIQPTLGISKASDTDTFRSSQFRSKAFDKAATDGDPNIFAPLYEDFIFKALQLVSQPKIKDQLIRGYVNQPGTDQKQSAFDAFLGDVGLEFKGFPKGNLTGSISKNLNDKYERYAKANPVGAAKIKESIIAFNEIGDKNQLPSDFGKNFSQLAGTSYSEMVKNNPDLVKGLSAETNMLLQRYVKDPAFLAMSAARGFIPNFAEFIETQIDAILQPISKSRTIQSKQLFGKTLDSAAIRYLNDTSIEKLNKYLEFDGYMEGALGIDFPDRADKKFLFTKNKGFIPNFAYVKSMIARVIPNTFRSLTDTKGTAFSNTNIGIARQKSFQSYDLTDEQVLSQAEINYPNLIMSILGNNAFIPDIDAVDKQSAGAQVYSAANIVSSFGGTTANKFDQYNPFGGGVYKSNPELIGTGSVQGKAIKLSYANVGKLGRRWENSKDPVVKDAWANLQKYAKMKLIYKARTSTGNDGSAFLNENSRRWYKDDIDKELRKYSEILKTEYNNYLKSINRIGTYVDIKGSAEAGLFGKDVNYMALRPDVLNKQLQGLPKFDWKNAANGIFYGDYKNNKEKYDRLAELMGKKWTYNNASKRMFLQSGGFIPNFAYKQSVMALEESMSGNKAIFDTKPFPHIRNSSQPTFSSAISDHGGLSNALSDSMRGQKSAGLMSRGFVPNFAPRPYRYSGRGSVVDPSSGISQYSAGLGFSLADQERRAKDEFNRIINSLRTGAMTAQQATTAFATLNTQAGLSAQAQTSLTRILNREVAAAGAGASGAGGAGGAGRAGGAIGAAFNNPVLAMIAPIVTGAIASEFAFQGKKRYELTESQRGAQDFANTGITSTSTGAFIGNMILPGWGAAIGAGVGALIGLTSALNATTLTAEELADLNQEQTQKAQANIAAASSYIEAQKSLTQMIASGASSSDIEIATKKLSNNFNEIKDVKLQEIFNATGGDVALMTKQLQDYTNQVTKESARQTGLYGANLKPEERASALSIGLGGKGSSDFIKKYKGAIKKADEQANFYYKQFSNTSSYEEQLSFARSEQIKSLAESIVPQNEPQRESKLKSLTENILNKNFDEVINYLEKSNIVSEANKAAVNFKQAATRSFNQIFLDMEQQIAKTAFETALSFEKDSGSRRIQSAILDFSTNFQDSINSFLSNNLPDARKFDFTANTAAQKAQLQLQKSQQDYDKALAEQENDRSNFLIKNAENLTKEFKSSFLPSQAAAEFYQSNVLPQIQQGTFTGNAVSLAEQFKSASFEKAKAQVAQTGFDLSSVNEAPQVLQTINAQMEIFNQTNETNTETYKKLQAAQQALIDLQNQTALFQNQNDMTKLQGVMDTAAREKELFETKQANAKKELEINKQLNEARIAVEKDIAVKKAAVDKENLMRMEKMKDLSANIGNALEIAKARSSAQVAGIQRRLNDPRETYGMGTAQITERRINLQNEILKEQRAAEDAAINAEIQQRILEMAAEQENTAATLALNDTIMKLIETQLQGALGGSEAIKEMQNNPYIGKSNQELDAAQESLKLKTTGQRDRLEEQYKINQARSYTPEQKSQFEAFQRIQESRRFSAENNTSYNTSTFESNIQSKGFNEKMTQAEQLTFLEKEETAARKAGNVVLAGTIKRYREQIDAKQKVLNITREQIDADIRLQSATERQLTTIRGRLAKGFGELNDEGDKLVLNLGENLPKMFADGMVNGIKAAIRESDNLGDALMGVAASFLDSISTTLMQAGTYKILGSLGFENLLMKQAGGLIRAQSGMYISGTGSGDKYPALLENGEYVLNRRAVMAMGGPAALDTLNFSMAPRFASGGSFTSELTDIKAMEEGMTTFGLENSSYYKELRDAELQRAEEERRKRYERKVQRAQMIGSLVAAVATIGIGAGISNKMQNIQAGKAQNLSAKLQTGQPLTNAESLSIRGFMNKGLINSSGVYTGPEIVRTGFSGFTGVGGRQTGGLIGSRLSDTIPGYMEGGLYNSPMVRKYGTGMQSGGMSSIANNSNVVNNSNASNSFNFNTTVNRDGTIQMGANNTSYKQQDVELSENLNNRIYGAVLDVIRDQQRFGGSLAGTRKA